MALKSPNTDNIDGEFSRNYMSLKGPKVGQGMLDFVEDYGLK